ncbi:hypothetical protein CQ018_17675, partial [Arthrobacter sp. MYb227]
MTHEDQSIPSSMRNRGRRTVGRATAAGAAMAVAAILGAGSAQAAPLPAAVTVGAAVSIPTAVNTTPITADGIATGEIKTSKDLRDLTVGKYTVSGHAWMAGGDGGPSTISQRLTAVPAGTKVYLQWKDTDGSVSPIYSAATHDTVTGEQGGAGTYAFKLPSWTDNAGKNHYFTGKLKQEYKLWIEPMKNPATGGELTMMRAADGMYPNRFVKTNSGSGSLGAVTIAGTNVQKTGIFLYEAPQNYMKSSTNLVEDQKGPVKHASVQLNERHTVSGTVWLESGAGDYSNLATGPNKNLKLGDLPAANHKVYVSMLTREGAAANDAIKKLPVSERAAATKKMLTANPEYISKTVVATTDANGNYTARMGQGHFDRNHMYSWVESPEGKIVSSYSSSTSPVFARYDSSPLWTPQTVPANNLVAPNIYNRHHAVMAYSNAKLSVTNFNVTDKPARPGDVAKLSLEGGLTPLESTIVWTNSAGETVKTCKNVTSASIAAACTFEVPADLTKPEIYTATLMAADNPVSADSFAVTMETLGNVNASASAAASANADSDKNAAAVAAAVAAANADASTTASASADANAAAAAQVAANADASQDASADANADANASAAAAANAASHSKADSDSNASASASKDANAAAAANSAATADASKDASSDAATDANADSNKDAEAGADANAEAGTDVEAGADANVEAGADANAEAGKDVEAGADANAEAGKDVEAGADANAEAGKDVEAGADANAEAGKDVEAGADANAEAGKDVEAGADANAEAGKDVEAGADANAEAGKDVEAGADANAEAGKDVEAGADANAEAGKDVEAGADANAEAGTDVEAGADANAEAGTDVEAGADANAEAGTDVEAGADANAEAGTDVEAGADANAEAGKDVEAGADANVEAGADANAEAG